jgi:hypothetical protein
MALGATSQPFTQVPQQYQQSPMSQILGLGSMLPFLLGGGLGGGMGSAASGIFGEAFDYGG